ncbi:hypothetical protein V6N13_098073 [Hibiscus sabdariffa]|uniref:Uncharacterized protein n=1 Tax=Hibiscus sabdariffa TaxID=183260 RepID=A0ABR2NW32_9ROSI
MVTLATALGREGTSAFRFDFAGNVESEGSFMYGNYGREAEDLRAVVQHFRNKERLITAIVGHSKGNLLMLKKSKAIADDQGFSSHMMPSVASNYY